MVRHTPLPMEHASWHILFRCLTNYVFHVHTCSCSKDVRARFQHASCMYCVVYMQKQFPAGHIILWYQRIVPCSSMRCFLHISLLESLECLRVLLCKQCYTRVLKGHIALSTVVIPVGTSGHTLDILARVPLWQAGLDYRHGTGHGVGAYLNVHEVTTPCGTANFILPYIHARTLDEMPWCFRFHAVPSITYACSNHTKFRTWASGQKFKYLNIRLVQGPHLISYYARDPDPPILVSSLLHKMMFLSAFRIFSWNKTNAGEHDLVNWARILWRRRIRHSHREHRCGE